MKTGKNIARFLMGTFLLSYAMWGIVFLAQEMDWFQYGTPISVVLVTIGANSPAISAYFAIKRQNKDLMLKKYMMDAFCVKQYPLHYLLVLLFIIIFFGVPAVMGGIAGQLEPYSGGTQATDPMPIWITVLAIPFFFFLGGSEELGWRHFLQPALEQKTRFFFATLMTACIWYVWHLPLFLITGTSQNSSNLLSFAIYIIGTAFAAAAIYRISKSAWLCIFFHCATNALQGSWPLYDDYATKTITSILLIAVSLVAVFLDSRRPLTAR